MDWILPYITFYCKCSIYIHTYIHTYILIYDIYIYIYIYARNVLNQLCIGDKLSLFRRFDDKIPKPQRQTTSNKMPNASVCANLVYAPNSNAAALDCAHYYMPNMTLSLCL